MKTIFLGDIHGRDHWKKIIEHEKPDRVVFIGDYFDSFNVDGKKQIENFKEIIDFKTDPVNIGVCETILLIGNHDYHYFKFIGERGTVGFQRTFSIQIGELLEKNLEHLQMAYQLNDSILCTHAGLTNTFFGELISVHPDIDSIKSIEQLINEIWKFKPYTFDFKDLGSSTDYTGDNKEQSCIWVRPNSLMLDCVENLIQIVGHTPMKKIVYPPTSYNNSLFFFIDTIGANSSGEYLIYDDSDPEYFSVKSWKDY